MVDEPTGGIVDNPPAGSGGQVSAGELILASMVASPDDDSLISDVRLRMDVFQDLMKRYESSEGNYLDLCYKYLNFYTGLLTTILAATIAGLVGISKWSVQDYALLAGPLGAIALAAVGYSNVKVFFRRYVEAWVTRRNVEELLGEDYNRFVEDSGRKPVFRSGFGGFIARYERPRVAKTLQEAIARDLPAEKVVEEVSSHGDTLRYARIIFWVFACASILLSGGIVWFAGR